MRTHRLLLAAACAAALPLAAQAPSPDVRYVRSLAATCANCHGTDGRSAAGAPIPTLAGMPRDQIAANLKAFKAGTRPSTIMTQLAKGYSDAQIEQLASYFAAQK
jgi:sulfide dehydrogenase cytochrome subunit